MLEHALYGSICHAGSRIHKFFRFHPLFQKFLEMGVGMRHSKFVLYSVKSCAIISFSLRHNVLCFSFVAVLYSMYSLYANIKVVLLDEKGCRV